MLSKGVGAHRRFLFGDWIFSQFYPNNSHSDQKDIMNVSRISMHCPSEFSNHVQTLTTIFFSYLFKGGSRQAVSKKVVFLLLSPAFLSEVKFFVLLNFLARKCWPYQQKISQEENNMGHNWKLKHINLGLQNKMVSRCKFCSTYPRLLDWQRNLGPTKRNR